jgi:hypothetical protein
MKSSLVLLILLISQISFGQTWCDAGATWKYSYVNLTAFGYTEIKYTGDTLISGQNASILDKRLYYYNFLSSQIGDDDLGEEYTYEDNGVIYLLFENNWDTLYNFNATVGESWSIAQEPLFSMCDSNSQVTVLATGTKTINSIALNYLVLDYGFPSSLIDTVIEKIGNIYNYLLPYDYCNAQLDAHEGGPFRCYEDDNFTLYKPHYTGECDFILEVNPLVMEEVFALVPNPATSVIEIRGDITLGSEYKIISLDGVERQSGIVATSIDISKLTGGTYLYLTLENGHVFTTKFIIQ